MMTSLDWKTFDLSPEEKAQEEEYRACRVTAVSYAAGFNKSSGQIRRKLEDEGYKEETIERVLPEMAKEGYSSDREICRSLMRLRRGRKAESHLALFKRLENRLVPRLIIEEELAAYPDDRTLAFEYLNSLTEQLRSLYDDADTYEEKQKATAKVVRKAASRGFSAEYALDWLRSLEIAF